MTTAWSKVYAAFIVSSVLLGGHARGSDDDWRRAYGDAEARWNHSCGKEKPFREEQRYLKVDRYDRDQRYSRVERDRYVEDDQRVVGSKDDKYAKDSIRDKYVEESDSAKNDKKTPKEALGDGSADQEGKSDASGNQNNKNDNIIGDKSSELKDENINISRNNSRDFKDFRGFDIGGKALICTHPSNDWNAYPAFTIPSMDDQQSLEGIQYDEFPTATYCCTGAYFVPTPTYLTKQRLHANFDLLYWRAYECGLSSGVGLSEVTQGFSRSGEFNVVISEEDFDPNVCWDLGFRAGLRWEFSDCGWDAALSATDFHTKAKIQHKRKEHGSWNLDFNQVDILIGKTLWICSCINWRPYGGLRWAQINQRLKTFHKNTFSHSSDGILRGTKLNDKEHFKGFGPVLGLGADWNLGCGFQLYGGVAGALLYGDTNVKFDDLDLTICGRSRVLTKQHLRGSQPVLDLEIGLCWHTYFCRQRMELLLQLGLEHHRFFNYNQLSFSTGDLCLEGTTLSAAIRF